MPKLCVPGRPSKTKIRRRAWGEWWNFRGLEIIVHVYPQARTKLGKLEPTLDQPPKVIQQQVIGILLAVEKEAEIQLLVSYVVSNASWRPKYDLRVSSAERTMQVSYFGMVKQNTGEDW